MSLFSLKNIINEPTRVTENSSTFMDPVQGVQCILFLRSVVLDFVKLNLLALMLLCVTQCTMWRLYFAFVNCLQLLEILSEI